MKELHINLETFNEMKTYTLIQVKTPSRNIHYRNHDRPKAIRYANSFGRNKRVTAIFRVTLK